MSDNDYFDEEIVVPINGELDLHTFKPNELASLIPEYILECQKMGIFELRIIHGKGKGVLRRTVHSLLQQNSHVKKFWLADETAGSWGATLVTLHKQS